MPQDNWHDSEGFPDEIDLNTKNWRVSRRQFLKGAALAATGVALAEAGVFDIRGAKAEGTPPLNPNYLPGPTADAYVHTMCEMCVWRCGVIAKVRDGKIHKLEGNPDHPHSLGNLCARGQSGLMQTYDEDRVLYPLMRLGDRGSGRFRRASWDEALTFVADEMNRIKKSYGPEAMVFSITHSPSEDLFDRLVAGYGSPNKGTQRSLCFNAMVAANLMTFGFEEPLRKYDDKTYIILTGRNMFEGISTSESKTLMDRIAHGAKVVVLDPRFTKTASKATEWLPVKPGTDSAFHLALINVIITEKLYNQWFVDKYTVGFDELAKSITSYTPKWASAITEIPEATIYRIAHEFAAAAPHAFAHPNWRTSNFVNSFQTERAVAVLNALVGLVSQDGDLMFADPIDVPLGTPSTPTAPRSNAARLDGVPWKYKLVPPALGVYQELRDAVLSGQPYQARGWFFTRQNPVMSLPDSKKTIEAFKKLELVVSMDTILNDSSWYADVILPEATYLERYDPVIAVDNRVFLRQPVIDPLGESKSALWIYKELGKRLGIADFFPYIDDEDYIRQQIAPHKISLEQLKQNGYFEVKVDPQTGDRKWNTPSGKVEITSETLRSAGYSAVPTWDPPPAPSEGQFYLLTGKVGQHTQFATQNNRYLNQVDYRTQDLWMNPAAAAKRGIKDGDMVKVASVVGDVTVKVWLTEGIRQDCVYLAPGFGHQSKGLKRAYNKGVSSSLVHQTVTDPISGGQALSQTFVTVERA